MFAQSIFCFSIINTSFQFKKNLIGYVHILAL
nr:MAG TPA: hypothetical protein [Caudoviricetes sp.]